MSEPKWDETIEAGPSWDETVDPADSGESWGRQATRAVTGSLPIVSGMAGAVVGAAPGLLAGPVGAAATGVAGGALGYAGGKEVERLANHYLLGDQIESETPLQQGSRVKENMEVGALSELGGPVINKGLEVIAPAVSRATGGANRVADFIGNKLRRSAEKLAVNATGATGAQASKFAPNAGRELLDEGIVRAGSTAEGIASRAKGRVGTSQQEIDRVLRELDARGIQATPEEVQVALQNSSHPLSSSAGTLPAARQAESMADDIAQIQGNRPLSLSEVEAQKRSFGNTNWQDPSTGEAQKSTYRGLRDLVEEKAVSADPALGETFKAEKKAYGMFQPIEEAASKRASTQSQQQVGNALDVLSLGTGAVTAASTDDPSKVGYGLALAGARRFGAPRIASTAAVAIDKVSKILSRNPQVLGSFAPVLQNAAKRGSASFATMNFLLQQSNPKFQTILREVADED